MQQEKDLSLIFWIALSALFGLSTSSIIAIKKDSTVGQTLLAARWAVFLQHLPLSSFWRWDYT